MIKKIKTKANTSSVDGTFVNGICVFFFSCALSVFGFI